MGQDGFTDWVGGICPYPFTPREEGIVFFCKLCLLPCSCIMCATSVAIGEVNDLQVRE